MKRFIQLLMMATLVTAVASCGKQNSSGSSSSKSSNQTDWYASGTNNGFGNYDDLKEYYMDKSLSSDLPNNTVIYHVGEIYGANYSNVEFDFDFNFTFCIGDENLFGDDDDCNYYGGNSTADLQDIVDDGEYKVVRNSTSTTVSFDLATGASNNIFTFAAGQEYNQTSPIFRKMLNIDNKPVNKIVVSKANAFMTNKGNIQADLVEYFFQDGSYEAYILSPDIPVIANPIAVFGGSYSVNGSVNFDIDGELSNVGQSVLTSVSTTVHRLTYNYTTADFDVVNFTTISKN
jgi:hypothetical protein